MFIVGLLFNKFFFLSGACKDATIFVAVSVRNNGPVSGHHSVLLFSKPPSSGVDGAPLKQLVSFERVHLESGAEQEVLFKVNPCEDLGTVGEDGVRTVTLGLHTLMVGAVHHPLIIVSNIINITSCASPVMIRV